MGTAKSLSIIPGLSLNKDEEEISLEIEALAPPDIIFPSLPRVSDIPYLDDFDDSGLDRFLQNEFDNCLLQTWKH